jgi:hypothetical protein
LAMRSAFPVSTLISQPHLALNGVHILHEQGLGNRVGRNDQLAFFRVGGVCQQA